MKANLILTTVLIGVLILSACNLPMPLMSGTQTPAPTATFTPTPTPRPEENIALNKPVSVSASLASNPPAMAIDKNLNNWWGAGGHPPQWIEINLQGLYSISRISLSISQSPSGKTVHRVIGRGPDQKDQVLHVFSEFTYDEQKLEFSPETPWQDIGIIRIETTVSPSWVSWREVQIFSREDPKPLPDSMRPESNIALNKPVRVSASWVVDPPERAVNGNANDWWGAGGPAPAWIEVDLQGIYLVSRINLIEGPTGLAKYQVFGRGPDGVSRPLHTFEVRNSQYQTLKFSPETALKDISTIRIEISDSGSGWVGIREIQVFSRDDPKPLPPSEESTFLSQVDPDDLTEITPENAIMMKQLAMFGRGPINELVWSPDGKILAAASPLGVWLYDPAALESAPRLLQGHTRDVLTVAFSPDGKTVLSASQDGTVKQWNAATGDLIRKIALWNDFSYEVGSAPREKEVWSLAFSPDATLLAAGAFDGTLRLWDLTAGRQSAVLKGHAKLINLLAFSPDGSLLVSHSIEGAIFVWDVEAGKQRATFTSQGQVQGLVFSPDGKTLAYGGVGMTVRLWDVVSETERADLTEHSGTLSLAFSPDGLTLASASSVGKVLLWDITAATTSVFREHADWIKNMAYSPDGKTLATYAWDGTLQLWDIATGAQNAVVATHTSPVNTVAFSPDGLTVASGGSDNSIRLWEVATNSLRATLWGHGMGVTSVAFSPDGKVLASGSFDRTVRLWESSTGGLVAILTGHEHIVRSVAFSPDGKTIASGSTDQTVRVWDVETGQERAVLRGHTGEVESVAFSPDGKWLVSGSADKSLRIWEVATGKEAGALEGHLSFVLGTAFSPDGELIASVSGDHWVRMWKWQSASGVVTSTNQFAPIGHPGWVMAVAFSPSGRLIASANLSTTAYYVAPGEIHLYLAETGYPYALLRGHTKRVMSVAFSPDGKLIASGSADGSVRLWGTSWKGFQPDPTIAPTPTPESVDLDLFVGDWAATDPGDKSKMTLTIARNGDDFDLTLFDEKAGVCGKDSAGKPKFAIVMTFTGTVQGDTLRTESTSATCLSSPESPLQGSFQSDFSYQAATDTLWDSLDQAQWTRRSSASWRDEFNTPLLEGWTWINENFQKWDLLERSGFMRIYVSSHKTGGENLLLRSVGQGDFVITTRLLFEPNTNFQLAGLVIYKDEYNFLQFGRAFCDVAGTCVGNGIYFDKIREGNLDGSNFATSVGSWDEAYLRLERRGSMVKALFSSDGVSWIEIGMHLIPSDFQIKGVGLTAAQDGSQSNIPADFDFFEVSAP